MVISVSVLNLETREWIHEMHLNLTDNIGEVIIKLLNYWNQDDVPSDRYIIFKKDGTRLEPSLILAKYNIKDGDLLLLSKESVYIDTIDNLPRLLTELGINEDAIERDKKVPKSSDTQDIETMETKQITKGPTQEDESVGILLLDVSYSMNIKDMSIENISHSISLIKEGFKTASLDNYLNKFEKGSIARRYEIATLAVLSYLSGRTKRKSKEKVSIILFSEDPQAITVNDIDFFSLEPIQSIDSILTKVITTIFRIKKLGTNMARGLGKCLAVADQFPSNISKNIILFTDGYPDDGEALNSLLSEIQNRKDIKINIAGIGKEINSDLMKQIASTTGGQYRQFVNPNDIIQWYNIL